MWLRHRPEARRSQLGFCKEMIPSRRQGRQKLGEWVSWVACNDNKKDHTIPCHFKRGLVTRGELKCLKLRTFPIRNPLLYKNKPKEITCAMKTDSQTSTHRVFVIS